MGVKAVRGPTSCTAFSSSSVYTEAGCAMLACVSVSTHLSHEGRDRRRHDTRTHLCTPDHQLAGRIATPHMLIVQHQRGDARAVALQLGDELARLLPSTSTPCVPHPRIRAPSELPCVRARCAPESVPRGRFAPLVCSRVCRCCYAGPMRSLSQQRREQQRRRVDPSATARSDAESRSVTQGGGAERTEANLDLRDSDMFPTPRCRWASRRKQRRWRILCL